MNPPNHAQLRRHAHEQVGLATAAIERHRHLARSLGVQLSNHRATAPGFPLADLHLMGSVASGTALASLTTIDLAVYVNAGEAPSSDRSLMPWLKDQLDSVDLGLNNPTLQVDEHAVLLEAEDTDAVLRLSPLFYGRNANGYGILVLPDSGRRILTSVIRHAAYLEDHVDRFGQDLLSLIQLTKHWAALQHLENPEFCLPSFMIDLLWCHLADHGAPVSDYQSGLEAFFAWLVRTELQHRVTTSTFIGLDRQPSVGGSLVEVLDPANPANNLGAMFSDDDRSVVLEHASLTLDALCEARFIDDPVDELGCLDEVVGIASGWAA